MLPQLCTRWTAVNSLAGASPDTHFSIAQRQLRDLPGEVSVSHFSAASHLLGPKHPLVFDLGGIPQDCFCCPYQGHFHHPPRQCTMSKWIILTSPSALVVKNQTDKGCDPVPSPACWRSRCCSTPWGGFASLSFCRVQWQILFFSYFCCWVVEKPTCCKAGKIHQPVENSWRAWNWALSPRWQGKWVLDSWGCSLQDLMCWEVAQHKLLSPCSVLSWGSHCLLVQVVQDR